MSTGLPIERQHPGDRHLLWVLCAAHGAGGAGEEGCVPGGGSGTHGHRQARWFGDLLESCGPMSSFHNGNGNLFASIPLQQPGVLVNMLQLPGFETCQDFAMRARCRVWLPYLVDLQEYGGLRRHGSHDRRVDRPQQGCAAPPSAEVWGHQGVQALRRLHGSEGLTLPRGGGAGLKLSWVKRRRMQFCIFTFRKQKYLMARPARDAGVQSLRAALDW